MHAHVGIDNFQPEEVCAGLRGTDGLPNLKEVLSPIALPCGQILQNRLVKAAMYEHLAAFLGGPPNDNHNALYAVWARGGWGMVITGNVQVSSDHLSLGADIVVPSNLSQASVTNFKQLARAMKGCDVEGVGDVVRRQPLVIMQLNHSGRQSPNCLGGRWPFIQRPLSASATRVGASINARHADNLLTHTANALLFRRSRAMTEMDIKEILESFVRGARLAVECGFDGIQIHAAHGYLVAQFISRKTNLRNDAYSSPLLLLHDIVQAIRVTVPKNFVVGIKLNAADYSTGGFTEAEVAKHLAEIAQWEWGGAGLDFIEISGGDYESPEFMQESTTRQAFFESFARVAVGAVHRDRESSGSDGRSPPLIMLTGGLRTRAQFSSVLERNVAQLLGLGRLSVLKPDLPNLLRVCYERENEQEHREELRSAWNWESQPFPEPRSPRWWPRLVGAGVGMAWYVVAMHRLAKDCRLPYGGENWILIVLEMYFGDTWRRWRFSIALVTIVAIITLFLPA